MWKMKNRSQPEEHQVVYINYQKGWFFNRFEEIFSRHTVLMRIQAKELTHSGRIQKVAVAVFLGAVSSSISGVIQVAKSQALGLVPSLHALIPFCALSQVMMRQHALPLSFLYMTFPAKAQIFIGGEFRVNTNTTGRQGVSSVAGLSNGNFVVTWDSKAQDPDGSSGVYGQLL